MADNIFEKLTDEEQEHLWMYMIFDRDKIIEKTEEWIKEAEKRGITLTEYFESINPLNEAIYSIGECKDYDPQESEEISERNMEMWEEILAERE